ncbi:MAG TPA: non-canonical purine NTP pyrophosphatase [Gaiellaceae bacterium]|nr:non-canonical purine NTP pyrophosphatase [Gaiellaceae bacterium]
MERLKVTLASANPHKARELAVLLPGWEIEPLDAERMPEEVGATFYENARAKARYGRLVEEPGVWVLGEDSGLEVEALGGRPGIRSARYAGEAASDEDNLELLLEELAGLGPDGREARYVCELVCLSPELGELRGSGTLEGRIAAEARGSGGFGYDPVFVPERESRTVAELGDEWKARSSHRARAAEALREAVGTALREE